MCDILANDALMASARNMQCSSRDTSCNFMLGGNKDLTVSSSMAFLDMSLDLSAKWSLRKRLLCGAFAALFTVGGPDVPDGFARSEKTNATPLLLT